ncbi:MAG: DUF1501 domain-containing protein [Myxococcaceae bacterium]
MKNNSKFSRRTLLQGAAVTAGALAYNGIPGTNLMNRAFGQTAGEKSALLIVFLDGGYNAVFPSADSFRTTGTFGITGDNAMRSLGGTNGLVVDAATFGLMPEIALTKMASVGLRHGLSDHGGAKSAVLTDGTRAHYLKLAAAMGGDAAIKAAVVGTGNPSGPRPAENGVTLQSINDMRTTIDALSGGAANDPINPNRGIATNGLVAAESLSTTGITGSPISLRSMKEGYAASVETLRKPVQVFNFNQMALAYNPNAGAAPATAIGNNFTQQMIAAELMIRAGANVVFASNGGWDSHGDRTAANVRNMMNTRILPPLNTFLTRTLDPAFGMNVNVVIVGDFSRSLPGSDHQNSLTATVIGKSIKPGTTGKLRVTGTNPNDARMVLDAPASSPALWSLLATACKVSGAQMAQFGENPHAALVG